MNCWLTSRMLLTFFSHSAEFNFGGFNTGGFNANNPSHVIGAAGGIGALLFAGKNVAEGNDQITLMPTLSGAYNPHTGQLVPQFGVQAQVGDDRDGVAPTFGLAGQFDGQGINPVATAGVNVGRGPLKGNINTGVVFDGQGPSGVNPTFGGGAAVGGLNLGNVFGGQGFNLGRR